MKIGIIGTGVFSVAIAHTLSQNTDNFITMWSENKELVEEYKKTNKMESIFKEKVFPNNIKLTDSYEEALKEIDLLFLMTSISYLKDVSKVLIEKVDKSIPICIGTKGIVLYEGKERFAYEIIKQNLKNPLALLSGPTYAEDVVSLDPIAFSIACKNKKTREKLLKAFEVENIKIEFTQDFKGVSTCGSLKNVYAIGSGIIAGLGYKESTLAYYITAVYKELETVLYSLNSSLATLHSLAGFGDLIATCSSIKSRNYSLGLLYGQKKNKKELDSYKENNTIEGFVSIEAFINLFVKKHIKTPIVMAIFKIVNDEEKPEYLLEILKESKLNSIY